MFWWPHSPIQMNCISKVTRSDLPIDRFGNLFSDYILLGPSVTVDLKGKCETTEVEDLVQIMGPAGEQET